MVTIIHLIDKNHVVDGTERPTDQQIVRQVTSYGWTGANLQPKNHSYYSAVIWTNEYLTFMMISRLVRDNLNTDRYTKTFWDNKKKRSWSIAQSENQSFYFIPLLRIKINVTQICETIKPKMFLRLQERMSLGLLRSDYLPHNVEENSIKQVEINTIASSFGGISTHMTPMHRYSKQFKIFNRFTEQCSNVLFYRLRFDNINRVTVSRRINWEIHLNLVFWWNRFHSHCNFW